MITVNGRVQYLKEVASFIGTDCDVVELGVLNGAFSEMIFNKLRPRTLTLIDPFEVNDQQYEDGLPTAYSTESDYQKVLKQFEHNKNVVIDRRYSYDAAPSYEGRSLDFIYIDACHLYECVKKDLNDWLPKLKKGGIMGLHDYMDLYGFGVIEAVDEWCIENNFEIIILNNNGYDVALKQKQ